MYFQVTIKSEPDEAYDDGVVIDGSYPDNEVCICPIYNFLLKSTLIIVLITSAQYLEELLTKNGQSIILVSRTNKHLSSHYCRSTWEIIIFCAMLANCIRTWEWTFMIHWFFFSNIVEYNLVLLQPLFKCLVSGWLSLYGQYIFPLYSLLNSYCKTIDWNDLIEIKIVTHFF